MEKLRTNVVNRKFTFELVFRDERVNEMTTIEAESLESAKLKLPSGIMAAKLREIDGKPAVELTEGGIPMDENAEMKRFADRLWDYFKPKIEELTRSNVWFFRAEVTKAAANGKITVQRPFDKEVALPYVSSMASAAVGSQVTVFVLALNLTNAVIIGDGTLSNL